MTGELSAARELLAALSLVVQVGSVAFVAFVATARLVGQDRLARAVAWTLLVLAQGVGVPLTLGMVGLLRLPAVLVLHIAMATAALVVHRRHPTVSDVERPDRRAWAPLDLAVLAASTIYVTLGVRLSFNVQRSFEFDTKEYHIANLASWLQAGHIWGLPYAQPGSMTANHPSSGEIFGLWLALPSHGDELVYLAPVAFGFLAILAGALLGRELSSHESGASLGALAAVAMVTAPIYFAQVDSLLTDLIATAPVVTAVALLVLARRTEGPAALVALAGIALGIGIGSKYTALLPGLAVGLVGIALLRRSRVWWWLVPGVLLLAAPWYLRNIITTGNPLFPQAIGPIDGANSPYDLLDTSMLDQIVGGETAILRTTARLARDFVGPLLVTTALGLGLPMLRWIRKEDTPASRLVWVLASVALALYLVTPYTGGGPTGLVFIIVSCFRYASTGVLLAAVVGVVAAGRRLGGTVAGLTIAWNLWQIAHGTNVERSQLDVSVRSSLAALAVAILAVVIAVAVGSPTRSTRLARASVRSAGALVAVVGILGSAAAYHHLDRGRTPTGLESTLLALGADRPAVVIGVADLRAVLGPRLERPLVKVSRGGAAEEIPFADEAQIRRRVLGDQSASAPPPALGRELDRAIDEAGTSVLVTGGISPTGFPDGWRPTDDWCLAGGDAEGTVFVRGELLPPGVECVPASRS